MHQKHTWPTAAVAIQPRSANIAKTLVINSSLEGARIDPIAPEGK